MAEGKFHPSLRVKAFKREQGMWEMTWAPDGRALWTYGEPLLAARGTRCETGPGMDSGVCLMFSTDPG